MDLCLMSEGQEGVTWPQWLALAQACEAHTIPALFRSEHRDDLADPDAFHASTQASWITGTADEVAERLGALRDAGLARVMCQQLLHGDLDHVGLIGELTALVA
jgi:alkanesulfonate monooxygenase SsuD/methylene tetrahydromethanopterin reductase-like flavin-dependent oxidoreductase (luciferase family)